MGDNGGDDDEGCDGSMATLVTGVGVSFGGPPSLYILFLLAFTACLSTGADGPTAEPRGGPLRTVKCSIDSV